MTNGNGTSDRTVVRAALIAAVATVLASAVTGVAVVLAAVFIK